MAAIVQQDYPGVTWWCPQLPPSPRQAMQEVIARIASWQNEKGFQSMAVMGSSLGGFYATWVAEKFGCRAVLLNPAVEPARDLKRYIGEQTAWHVPEDRFYFKAEFIDELNVLKVEQLKAALNYMTIIAKGDEVLDWREMTTRYKGTQIQLLEGGDHALSDFAEHLPAILDFLKLRTSGV